MSVAARAIVVATSTAANVRQRPLYLPVRRRKNLDVALANSLPVRLPDHVPCHLLGMYLDECLASRPAIMAFHEYNAVQAQTEVAEEIQDVLLRHVERKATQSHIACTPYERKCGRLPSGRRRDIPDAGHDDRLWVPGTSNATSGDHRLLNSRSAPPQRVGDFAIESVVHDEILHFVADIPHGPLVMKRWRAALTAATWLHARDLLDAGEEER
mmetsp:Transcript_14623/g.40262  ORF Transcript_14623/g.40262 Transcript_14623/m.40262 type:complete len:213 (-) Transcript_14623:1042-1680(-)